jgi:hypothetical protein
VIVAVGPVVTVKKLERFLQMLFQAAGEIIKEIDAEGHRFRFPRLRQFPQALSFFFGSFFFLCGKAELIAHSVRLM